ncbi:MAG TPA: hypothetical protein VFU59_12255 [Candidatus Eisenbacteria bacterium]|nr:hypothetical protein [Candidatus Eisenbacteria bacterium]
MNEGEGATRAEPEYNSGLSEAPATGVECDHPALSPTRVLILCAVALVGAMWAGSVPAYEERAPEPTADYPTLAAARDSVGAMIERVVRATASRGGKPIRLSRERSRFQYWYARGDSVDAWTFRLVVTDASECPLAPLERAFGAAGWTAHHAYMADGPDGSAMGFVSQHHFCVVEGRWDGGDDSDSTYVPDPGCEILVICVPRRMDDVPR